MSMMTAQMTPIAPYDCSCLVLLFVLPFLLLIDLGPIYSLLEALYHLQEVLVVIELSKFEVPE